MTTPRRSNAPEVREPLWREDARERLVALLPELAVSVVAFSCLAVVVNFSGEESILSLMAMAVIVQVLVQAIMYASTYLCANFRLATAGWMFAILGAYGLGFLFAGMGSFGVVSSASEVLPMVTAMFGIMLFCLTRVRWLFVALVLEVLALADVVGDQGALLAVHLVGACALAALYVMRSSATRITTAEGAGELAVASREDGQKERSMHGRVALFAVAVASIGLVVALVGSFVLWRREGTGLPADSVPSTTSQPQSQTGADQGASPGASQGEASPSAQQGAQTEALSTQEARQGFPWGPVIALGFLALVLLPFVAREARLLHARSLIEGESRLADRVARLYVGIVSRLDAVGIVREASSTPTEFLYAHAEELAAVAADMGFDESVWEALTDAYEKARYAGLDPAPAELQTCWRLYDALPAYARKTLGLRRYLAGPFWRM